MISGIPIQTEDSDKHVKFSNVVQLQTYTPDTITFNSSNEEFKISGGIWDGRTLYDLYGCFLLVLLYRKAATN